MQKRYGKDVLNNKYDSLSRIILQDVFIREPADNEYGCKIRMITWHPQTQTILKDEYPENGKMYDFPMVDYKPESMPGHLYPIPMAANWLDLLKTINRMYNSAEEYAKVVAKGRWIKKKGNKISRATDQRHGQMLEYTGAPPEPMAIPPLPNTVTEIMDRADSMLRDITGIHNEAMGKQSSAGMAAKAIMALQAASELNVSEPTDNLKTALKSLAMKVMDFASKHINSKLAISYVDERKKGMKGEKTRGMYVKGKRGVGSEDEVYQSTEDMVEEEYSPDEDPIMEKINIPDSLKDKLPRPTRKVPMEKEVFTLEVPDEVRVEIVGGGAFSKQARQAELLELFQVGAIDPQTYFEERGGFSNVQEIVERINKMKEEQADKKAAQGAEQLAQIENPDVLEQVMKRQGGESMTQTYQKQQPGVSQ